MFGKYKTMCIVIGVLVALVLAVGGGLTFLGVKYMETQNQLASV